MYKYKPREQTFFDIADDVLSRYITATAILDYHTIIGADKFENIFVSRVPQSNPFYLFFRCRGRFLEQPQFLQVQVGKRIPQWRALQDGTDLLLLCGISCYFHSKGKLSHLGN